MKGTEFDAMMGSKTDPIHQTTVIRCPWVGDSTLERTYHDEEWGVPVYDDRALFECLTLEGAQAGLSWVTVLRKRDTYRSAFSGFDLERVARFGPVDVDALIQNKGIIRHRGKIESTVTNARAVLDVQSEFGSFSRYVWRFVDGSPIRNQWKRHVDVPALTPTSERLSRDLKHRGFRFVGPTTCYAFMQAVGMVDDHTVDCFRHGCLRHGSFQHGSRDT